MFQLRLAFGQPDVDAAKRVGDEKAENQLVGDASNLLDVSATKHKFYYLDTFSWSGGAPS